MKRTLLACAFLLTPFLFADGVDAKKPKPKVQLKIATLAPDGSTWMNLMHEMDDRVREATGNEVGFNVASLRNGSRVAMGASIAKSGREWYELVQTQGEDLCATAMLGHAQAQVRQAQAHL